MVTVSPLTKGEINKSCNHSKDNIKCLNLYALNRISDKFMTLKCKKKNKLDYCRSKGVTWLRCYCW